MTFSLVGGRWRRPWPPLADDRRRREAGASFRGAAVAPRVDCLTIPKALITPIVAMSIAMFVASPWIDQRLVWCEWVGLAAALLMVGHMRGWWG